MDEEVWSGTWTNPNKLHAFLNGVGQPAACHGNIYTAGPLKTMPEPVYGNQKFAFCQRCIGHVVTAGAR